jgi:arabinogalactan oligomer/maltooligosaccharide transport system substrate-binding protein
MPVPSKAGNPVNRGLVIWHGFTVDSREEQTLQALLNTARHAQPNLEIVAHAVTGNQLHDRFELVAAAGGGPDLVIGPNDHLLRQARAELLRNLDADIGQSKGSFAPNAIGGMLIDGKVYGVPLSRSTIGLYYNRAKVAEPPKTTQELIDAAKAGQNVVLVRSSYHNFAFLGAFGGQLFNEEGRCTTDAGGVAEAFAFLRDLKAAGANFVTDGSEAQTLFTAGEAAITLNGSWLLGDYRAALGDQLGVAAVPAGPAGPAKPLVSGTGIFVNANSPNHEQALELALRLTDAEAQLKWADEAGLLPANPSVAIADEAVGGLAAAALTGVARPQRPELDTFWQPFDAALAEVLDNNADPVAAVQGACTAVNQANGK